jgi:hypothetical protein
MELTRPFEDDLRRRLRAELDAVEIRTPVRDRRVPAPGYLRPWRPLAVALIASLALGALAAAVTKSPDPARWVQPAVWARALGDAPPSTSGTPASPAPPQAVEPEESPTPAVTEQPSRETEPAESRLSRPQATDSPDAGSREGGRGGGDP